MEYVLNWTEIKPINEIEYTKDHIVKGVYIWGFKLDSKFIPYYLGIAEDIKLRLLEHVNSLLGGKYAIYNKDYLHEFYNHKSLKVSNEKIIYIPNWPSGYHDFLQRFKELQPHLNYMVENLYYSFAELKDIERKGLYIIEKNCINEIDIKRLHLFRGGATNSNYQIKVTGASAITNLFKKKGIQRIK